MSDQQQPEEAHLLDFIEDFKSLTEEELQELEINEEDLESFHDLATMNDQEMAQFLAFLSQNKNEISFPVYYGDSFTNFYIILRIKIYDFSVNEVKTSSFRTIRSGNIITFLPKSICISA